MTKENLPQHFRYLNPILEVLQAIGGSGKISEVIDLVIEKLNISDEELQVTVKNGQPEVINLDSSRRGIWNLTEKGLSATLSESDMVSIWQLIMLRGSPKS